jgi:hypothetical protein
MTRSREDRNGLSAPDVKVLEDIQRVGWHVTGVFARKDEDGPEWAFSVGLFHSFGHPEVIIFGLPLERCVDIVNVIGKEVKAGKRFEPGYYADILQDLFKCAFQAVDRQHYRDHVSVPEWSVTNCLR